MLQAGESVRRHGLPRELAPFVVVFTSNGKASRGAQEVFELLPHQWVHASELATLPPDRGHLFGCVVETQDHVKHRQGAPFCRNDYYAHGASMYQSSFKVCRLQGIEGIDGMKGKVKAQEASERSDARSDATRRTTPGKANSLTKLCSATKLWSATMPTMPTRTRTE